MRRLGLLRRINRLREGRDRGTVALLVAVLVGSGVLLGCAALTIDVGNLQAERRQLQNGADAAAYSAMSQCAKGTCPTAAGLEGLAGQNAADGFTYVRRMDGGQAVCGQVSAPATIPSCTSLPGGVADLNDCPTPPSLPAQWVRVYTQTELKDGSTILPYYFAQTLTGAQSDRTQQTCASAGLVGGYPTVTLPVTEAQCAWDDATSKGTDFPPLPPYSSVGTPLPNVPVAAKYVTKLILHTKGGSEDPLKCGSTGPGLYTPGNFGWLDPDTDPTAAPCTAKLTSDTGVVVSTGKPGSPPKKPCDTVIPSLVGSIVYVPIFSTVTGTGSNTSYTINGVAAFYLAGGRAPSMKPFDAYNPVDPAGVTTQSCSGKDDKDCLWGWFLAPLVPAGQQDDGTDRGPKIIVTLG